MDCSKFVTYIGSVVFTQGLVTASIPDTVSLRTVQVTTKWIISDE